MWSSPGEYGPGCSVDEQQSGVSALLYHREDLFHEDRVELEDCAHGCGNLDELASGHRLQVGQAQATELLSLRFTLYTAQKPNKAGRGEQQVNERVTGHR